MYKHSITTFLRSGEKADGTRQVQLRVAWNGQRVTLSLPISVRSTDWDTKKGRVRASFVSGGAVTPYDLNNAIQEAENALDTFFLRCDVAPTPQQVRGILSQRTTDKDNACISEAIEAFIKSQSIDKDWEPATVTSFRMTISRLDGYRPWWLLRDITAEALANYTHYLENVRGLRNDTIAQEVKRLRWFARWAVEHDYPAGAILTYKPKIKQIQREVIYLTWDELTTLATHKVPAKYDAVRDLFCFCCFSGLRYSDAIRLRWEDVSDGSLRIVTQKTAEPLTIELNAYTRAILDKYREGRRPRGYVLPIVSNAWCNRQLKEICQLLKIDSPTRLTYYKGRERYVETRPKYELITFHTARRTFVVNALRLGIDPLVIMKWTGHKGFDAMRPYIAIADELKAESMAKFDVVAGFVAKNSRKFESERKEKAAAEARSGLKMKVNESE